MRIYGFMLVKNEVDILQNTLESLLKFGSFEHVYIFDNGSTDGTYELAKSLESSMVSVNKLEKPFSDNLKYETVYEFSKCFETGDWFAILDADELYAEPLLPIIESAIQHGSNMIATKSAQFYFSDNEESFAFNPKLPATQQRNYYLINYGEPRVFRFEHKKRLSADYVKSNPPYLKQAEQLLAVMHFQFRSAEQTQLRIDTRIKNNKHSGNWGHITGKNWRSYIVDSKYLHKYDGSLQEGLPDNVNLFRVRNNAAYSYSNLKWMEQHNYLKGANARIFIANRFEKLIRKLWSILV
ncbi:glycosyltransferase family 2 protein [Glaciecola sp. KUL10]|uniref:glycosyltransferase family 2 protein n=1 Tax=Glaciecola sp. (strain KUL10) TaxID=2161813 RepID=UPI000D784EA6|nr:glycosyltransferase family 2 protein [Glaciecola sp. KUL10]GBL04237.1 hypothetical protein KUL10_15430 [Glaciecola sp. KUL10]